MRARPILFSGPMVRAILDGRKTQTRRIVKVQDVVEPDPDDPRLANWVHDHRMPHPCDYACTGPNGEWRMCPYGEPGDTLWVREAIVRVGEPEGAERWCASVYEADNSPTVADCWPWKVERLPSIHCPRGLSRISLRVTSVRVERLQDISESDACAEGVEPYHYECIGWTPHKHGFANLWDTINGKRAPWSSNPWVWVVGFERFDDSEVPF